MTLVPLWRLVGVFGGVLLVAVASVAIAHRRRQRCVLLVAGLSWAVGVWAALTSAAALL